MAKLSIVAGATSQSVTVFIQNSQSTVGAGLTGLVFNSTGLIAYYTFSGANTTATAITLATLATVTTAYSSGGFIEIDATHTPGLYRLDLPNAALATAKGRSVVVYLSGAANMAPCLLEIGLTAYDNQNGANLALTAIPSANPGASTGIFIAGTNAATSVSGLTLIGAAAVGATPATAGLSITGGAASTTALGVSASGLVVTGGAGAASTNGAAAGATFTAGGTTTVSGNDGFAVNGTGNGNGFTALHSGTGLDLNATTSPPLNVNVANWKGTAVATPATAGIPDINVKNYNNQVAATDANNLPKVDTEDWKGTAVVAPATAGIPDINLKNIANAAVSTTTAQLGVNAVQWNAQTTQTDANNLPKMDVADWNGTAVGALPTNFSVLSIDASGRVTLVPGQLFVKKNTAITITFPMTDSTTHAPKTGLGATVTAQRSIDGAAIASCANAVSELSLGVYALTLAAADVNGAMITVILSATASDTRFIGIVTQP